MTTHSVQALVEPSFWKALSQMKINDKMLDETPFPIKGFLQAGRSEGAKSYVYYNRESLIEENLVQPAHFISHIAPFPTYVHLTNLRSSFVSLDRKQILKSVGNDINNSIATGEWLEDPSLLLKSVLTVFGDLKKWTFEYMFAFPYPKHVSLVLEALDLPESLPTTPPPSWACILKDGEFKKLSEATPDSIFCFTDPSTTSKLGWPIKALSLAVTKTFKISKFRVLRLNYNPALFSVSVELNEQEEGYSGWYKASSVDMSRAMDPMALFKDAASLNLSLMKWRMAPNLDLDLVKRQKVLIIGCGTLGCYVSRVLLGWGVRNFALVDSGRVSFSNPPRQPLFTYEDCLDGGKLKAEAAAEELHRICPDVTTSVHILNVPMPGHEFSDSTEEKIASAVSELDKLVEECDTAFLLTDTRESRWLPTLLCTARGKNCISIALGFDTYSVVRNSGGCYFCNDTVAPTDTVRDRTLDMQCTVTRPGIAAIASAMGVEIWAAALQNGTLGEVPQQLRFFMRNWELYPLEGAKFKCCVACSDNIVNAWKSQGWEFMRKALKIPGHLDDVSGLTEMKALAENEDCEWDDEELN